MNEAMLSAMLAALNPDIVAKLKLAIEIGKWPDGRRLTREQVEVCMQAVLAWEIKNLPEHERTGYIDKGSKEGEACDSHEPEHDQQFVKFLH